MRCVVTGGSGFIGQWIVRELARDPGTQVTIFDIVAPDCDIVLPKNVKWVEGDIRYMDEVLAVTRQTDEVYNIAGALGTSELINTSRRATDTNVLGTLNVLEAARINGLGRVFYPTKPNDWLNTYSISKFAGEQYALMYQQVHKMNVCVLKWFNAYGPRQHPYPVRKLIPTMCLQAIHGQPMTVYGNGEQTVDLIDVRDIANVAVNCTRNHGRVPKVLDVGSGVAMTVNSVAEMLKGIAGTQLSHIRYKAMRAGEPEQSDIQADVVALRSIMDLDLRPIGDGLRETLDYYRHVPEAVVRNSFQYWGESFIEQKPSCEAAQGS